MNKLSSNERELKFLSTYSPKQKEIYYMKKFISRYRAEIGGSRTECLEEMNKILVEQKLIKRPKKHLSTISRLWNEPFISYEN